VGVLVEVGVSVGVEVAVDVGVFVRWGTGVGVQEGLYPDTARGRKSYQGVGSKVAANSCPVTVLSTLPDAEAKRREPTTSVPTSRIPIPLSELDCIIAS
jgi:hypothetical protein